MEIKYLIKSIGTDEDYTDLAFERQRVCPDCEGIEYRREPCGIGYWERVRVTGEKGEKAIGRPKGIYDSLCLGRMDRLDDEEKEDSVEEVARQLCRICDSEGIYPDRILIVGLGNTALTPDSLGGVCASMVRPTLQIKDEDEGLFYSLECSEIAVLKCDVTANSGMDASEVVRGVCQRINPDVIIAIDALAARSAERLGTTIQISSTGIHPGSGIGNQRGRIDEYTLGVPVLAIGVPTVINSRVLITQGEEIRAPRRDEGMLVCPTAIGEITRAAAAIIAGGINQAFGLDL